MKKVLVLWLAVLFGLLFFQTLPVKAYSNSVISLEEQNIILPYSDVNLISLNEKSLWAVVDCRGKYWLFLSKNRGKAWQKVIAQGLPENEKFVSLKTPDTQPETVVLATKTKVYISYDKGEHFECLGGPPGLKERREEITSLAISNNNPLQILVGIWHPSRGKFAEEGVYLWGLDGRHTWESQGMKEDRRGGYSADVTSVAFLESNILVVAIGDPDDNDELESLPEGTYLNIAHPSQKTRWNRPSDWPIEISRSSGESPTELEIMSSKIVLSEFERGEGEIYIIYNSRQKDKDGVYRVKLSDDSVEEVRKLKISEGPEIRSFDGIDYFDDSLVVGATTVEGAQVYYLSSPDKGFSSSKWKRKSFETSGFNSSNCQVVIASDDTIFVGTCGQESCFSRIEKKSIIPISLLDASRGIRQLSISPDFLADRTIYLNYGNRNILKLRLDESCRLDEAERVFFSSRSFSTDKIGIEPGFDQYLCLFESGKKNFLLSEDAGRSWTEIEKEAGIADLKMVDSKIWLAGEDGLLYLTKISGTTQARISSGMDWLQKVELGPEGKIIAIGGSKKGFVESLSLIDIDKERYQLLPSFPLLSSRKGAEVVVYSPETELIYCAIANQLYSLTIGRKNWEKIADFKRQITEISVSAQGLYVFCQPEIYFAPFPLDEENKFSSSPFTAARVSKDSQWSSLEREGLRDYWSGCQLVGIREKQNLLILWDNSKILLFIHKIPEEKIKEIQPSPVGPEPVEPKPLRAETKLPIPPAKPPASIQPQPVPSQRVPSTNFWLTTVKWIAIALSATILLGFIVIGILAR